MINRHLHHDELMWGISEQMKSILHTSQQAVYIYLDDIHKVCNRKFASLLGYASPEEWARIENPFAQVFVDPGSQEILAKAYQQAMENSIASSFNITWKKKNGEMVDTSVILVPTAYGGHSFALYFIS